MSSHATEMAAALFESLVMNYTFIDGNKRTAFFPTDVFSRWNAWRFKVDPDEAHAQIVGLLEQGRCDVRHLLTWIRESPVRA